jgi:iron(III) transport system substrate-binding protein
MKKIVSIFLALIIFCGLIGCQNVNEKADMGEQSQQETQDEEQKETQNIGDKIVVYISGPEEMIKKLEEGFEADKGDVSEFVIMSCGQVRSKTWTEKEAGQIQADVVLGSDPLLYEALQKEDLLLPIELKELDKINEEFLLENKSYYYVNERYIGIIYNTDVYKDNIPKKYEDLTKEDFINKTVMADASQSATALAITASLHQMMGNSSMFFEKLKDNQVNLVKANGMVPSSILEGQFSVGIGPSDSVIRLIAKGKKEGYPVPLGITWPEEGTIAIQRPIAVVKNASRSTEKTELAKELVNYLVSKPAQNITINAGFVSVRNDVENKHLRKEGIYKVAWEKLYENEKTIKEEYSQIFHK